MRTPAGPSLRMTAGIPSRGTARVIPAAPGTGTRKPNDPAIMLLYPAPTTREAFSFRVRREMISSMLSCRRTVFSCAMVDRQVKTAAMASRCFILTVFVVKVFPERGGHEGLEDLVVPEKIPDILRIQDEYVDVLRGVQVLAGDFFHADG